MDLRQLAEDVEALIRAHRPGESYHVSVGVWRHARAGGYETDIQVEIWDGKEHYRGLTPAAALARMREAYEPDARGVDAVSDVQVPETIEVEVAVS